MRRFLVTVPLALAVAGALVYGLVSPERSSPGPVLSFTVGDQPVETPIDRVVIRRRTITPEFNGPLPLRAGRVVFARGFVACDPGEIFTVEVRVTQGAASGQGRTAGRCTGNVQEWTAVVPASGRASFEAGPADACGVATTRLLGVTDRFEWCGRPVLAAV